ncbi:hypothetical protein GWI34_29420 [Actinomadura sp. DSM 109109]|nr:hypothetical protein [Actinomadura lepetitiana]
MPRTRYTRLVHERDEALLTQQLRDLRRLAWALRRRPAEPVGLPAVNEPKKRRRDRIKQNQRRTVAPQTTTYQP